MTEMLFYQRAVPLDSNVHRNLRIKPESGFGFAAKTNSVPLVSVEFAEAAKEYPIVFVKASDGAFMPVALTGLRENENLFVDAAGKWQASYVPAFVRRYPFVPSLTTEKRLMVCVDEVAECLNRPEGMALFVNGKPSPYLAQTLDLLQEYQNQIPATQGLSSRLAQFGLLVPTSVEAKPVTGGSFALAGGHVVDEKRLRTLNKVKVLQLFNGGLLALIYAHLISLGNFQKLLDRLATRETG